MDPKNTPSFAPDAAVAEALHFAPRFARHDVVALHRSADEAARLLLPASGETLGFWDPFCLKLSDAHLLARYC